MKKRVTFLCEEKQHSFVVTTNVKKKNTNIQGMWNRLVHRSEKRRLCVTNKIVRMGALIALGKFSLI
jgi:hypothetical protein